jgi:hypothetical protein
MALKQRYVEEITEGKLYRVRDKNKGNNTPYIVWGSGLPHDAAHKLKEVVTGQEKSRTARLEEMTIPLTGAPVTPKGEPHVEAQVTARMLTTPPRSSLVTPTQGHHPDPQLAAVQQRAMAAASVPAQQAQQRADNLIALPQHDHPNDALPFAPEVPEGAPLEVPDGIDGDIDELVDGGEFGG